jgi:hypothetical protein
VKYQLVLQFPSDSFLEDADAAALEQDLIQLLGDSAYVDGHDLGASETSIFVFTADPVGTFDSASTLLKRRDLFDCVTAAQREADGDTYTVIWPEDCRKEFKLS